jgi:hypothetical protein
MTDSQDYNGTKDILVLPLPETICVSRELMVAQARIQKLEQQLDWFARGKFINEWDSGHDMAARVMRRALGAIKYLADE